MKFWKGGAGGSGKRGPALVLFVAAVILASLGFWAVSSLGGALELWGAACMAAGAIIGFLFGLPRTVQRRRGSVKDARDAGGATAPQEGEQDYAQLVNTNLEELSDWLTKILVGLGLTQLERVPSKLQAAAAYIASGMKDPATAAVGASAMIVYFSILGFLSGYLLMRLAAAPALRAADVDLAGRIDRVDAKVDEVADAFTKRTDEAIRGVEHAIQRADQAGLAALIESALADLRRDPPLDSSLDQDIHELEPLVGRSPTDRRLHIVLGRLYDYFCRYDKSIPLLTSFLEAKKAKGETTDQDVADVLYNRACSRSLKSAAASGEERERLQKQALDDLRKSIELLPPNRGEAACDRDFKPMTAFDEFTRLVGPCVEPNALSSPQP